MTKPQRWLSGLVAAMTLFSCSRQEGTPVAKVGKETLTREQLTAMVPPEVAAKAGKDVYLDLARRWVRVRLLAGEARNRELQDNLEVRRLIRERTDEILAQAIMDRLLDTVPEIPETDLRKYYEDNQPEFQRSETELSFRRIKVGDLPAATALIQKLTPVNFVAESQKLNPDPVAAMEAQRMYRRSELPPGVGDALFPLSEGEVSPPVKIADGYGIFLVTSKVQAGTVRPFVEVADVIRVRLSEMERKRRIDVVVAELARRPGVEIITKALPGSDSAAPKK